MDNIRNQINKHKDRLGLVLFSGALIAAFNCLAKPDYNIVSYLYLYYVWNMIEDKVYIYTINIIIKLIGSSVN